jgi:hypothetical protein
MALKGTLADLGVIDLVQFPHAGRKTGKLLVTSKDQEANLYYVKGALVHATLDDTRGMDALVRMVDWTEGAFEFFPDVAADARSIDVDLHRAVMQALKVHDELRRQSDEAAVPPVEAGNDAIAAALGEYVSGTDFVIHASVIASDGSLIASSDGDQEPPEAIGGLRETLFNLVKSYPRGTLKRAIIDDSLSTVVLQSSRVGGIIVVARKDAPLGAVAMSAGRLVMRLE